MDHLAEVVHLVLRQSADGGAPDTTTTNSEPAAPETPQCDSGNKFDGKIGLRISAIFVILIGSLLGKCDLYPQAAVRLTAARGMFSRLLEAKRGCKNA